jgi:FKBP-type peptidyl-prolyl cis-trans isomerase
MNIKTQIQDGLLVMLTVLLPFGVHAEGYDNSTPGILQTAEKYSEARQRAEKAEETVRASDELIASLKQQALISGDNEKRALATQNLILTQRAENAESTSGELKKQVEEMTSQIAKLNQQLESISTEPSKADADAKTAQRTEPAENEVSILNDILGNPLSQSETKQAVTADMLKDSGARRDYAMGVMTARNIQEIRFPERSADTRFLLAGLQDALNQQVLLSNQELQTALDETGKRNRKLLQKTKAEQKRSGEAYVATFRKENKDARKAESGFWYRVDYEGDGALISGDETSVEVVLIEKLTDGTVVEDMDISGRSLTMQLRDFPPLFRDALVMLKNHGTITLVAPPHLAYGDEGWPPEVPPGATMVYTLRVENVTQRSEVKPPFVVQQLPASDDNEGSETK